MAGKGKNPWAGGVTPSTGSEKCWLPICNRLRTTPGGLEPEVWFRIVHLAQETPCGAPVAAYREQIVEIALGPKGAFENGNIGSLFRRAPPDQLLGAAPPCRGDPKPPRESKTPRVVKLLRSTRTVTGVQQAIGVVAPPFRFVEPHTTTGFPIITISCLESISRNGNVALAIEPIE